MFTQDLLSIFFWWLMLFLLGLISLPLTARIFNNFFDAGYAFSKTLGILFLSYLAWILGSLKILPFTREALVFLFILICVANLAALFHFRKSIKTSIGKKLGIFVFEEVLFFSALTCWALIRGFLPDIRGLEKFMDYGFMNAIISSNYFPPIDMWYAGEHINYYYFGHLISAVLTKLSDVVPGVAYNLMIATIFALTFTSSFSLVGNLLFNKFESLKTSFIGGFAASLLVSLGGNFHTIYIASKNVLEGNAPFLNYWYPDATRFIVQQFGAKDNTIHEFPIYSFVVADLHGHLINLPSVLLLLAIVFSGLTKGGFSKKSLLLLSFLFGIFYITNSWDLPVYLLVFGISLLFLSWQKYKFNIKSLLIPAVIGAGVLAGSFVFTLPFHIVFENISKGVALSDYKSPLWMLLVLWSGPLIVTTLFGIYSLKKRKPALGIEYIFIVSLLIVSWILIMIPEILYVKDIYIDSYQRANTMFKFTYQSFVMFALSSTYILIRLTHEKFSVLRQRPLKLLVLLPSVIYLAGMMIYPYFAIKSFYGLKTYKSLNGEYWLFKEYPGEYRALGWIRDNLSKRSVILSAPGDSYSDYGVLQSYSGMPTVQGWFVHEWLWRGNPEEPTKRVNEVETIYTSESLELTHELLKKYSVEYIVVGKLEKDKYINLRSDKFLTLGQLVFRSDGTEIYQIN